MIVMKNDNADIKKIIADLNERKKELDCLYEINGILRNTEDPLNEIFNKIINKIPSGWQFPEICKSQIIFDGKHYKSEGLQITELKQSSKIKIEDTEVGEIQVYYIKPVKPKRKTIFLFEEQKLLNTIAEEISNYITFRRFKDLLHSDKNISEKLNIPTGLSKWLSNMHLSEQEITKMLNTKINFKKSESIFKQGTIASYILILTRGLSKAFVEDINERSFSFKIIKPYEIIGLSSLFGEGHYAFSATALTPSEGYLIEKDTMIEIIENNMKFNFELLKWYSSNFRLTLNKINLLANKQALGRIASTLIYLSNNIFNNRIIENTITRKNIAELSGMSTENAVRILSELKSDGIIKVTKNGIEVIYPDLLRTFSIAG